MTDDKGTLELDDYKGEGDARAAQETDEAAQ